MYRVVLGFLLLIFAINPAFARHHHQSVARVTVDPGCNIIFPCEGVSQSPQGLRVVKAMGGFGATIQQYAPTQSQVVANPVGCPPTAFCGCGASVRKFGRPVRELYLASNWYKFPRAMPAPGMAAVRAHHVFIIEAVLGGGMVLAYDANSGHHATRIHPRSLSGYTVVNPS